MRLWSFPTTNPFHRLGILGYLQPNNFWYRKIIATLRRIICLRTSERTIETESETLSTSTILIRGFNSLAIKAVLVNYGLVRVLIYEKSHLVAIVKPNESKELPFYGKFEIHGKTESGTAMIDLVTYLRGECGQNYFYGSDSVGAYLL